VQIHGDRKDGQAEPGGKITVEMRQVPARAPGALEV
jgi:hypothetical protein